MGMMCSVCGVGVDSSGVVWHQYGCNAVERELPLVASSPDPRDAEIARLKAEVERLRRCLVVVGDQAVALGARYGRALAAGPAALHYRSCDCCSIVERAQAEAMKEGT